MRSVIVSAGSRRIIASAVCLSSLAVMSTPAASTTSSLRAMTEPLIIERDGIRVVVGPPWKTHFRIEVDGIPFTDSSRFYTQRPGLAGRYYGYEDDPNTFRTLRAEADPSAGVRLVVPLKAPRGEFNGIQTVELLPNRRLRLIVNGAFIRDAAGILEHKIGGIYSGWIAGRRYAVSPTSDDQPLELIAAERPPADENERTIIGRFNSLRLHSRYGPIAMRASGSVPVSLRDFRRNKSFEDQPIFWLGVAETSMTAGAKFNYELEIDFPPKPDESAQRPPQSRDGAIKAIQHVLAPEIAPDVVLPMPKHITWRDQNFDLSGASVQLKVPDELRAEVEEMIAVLRDDALGRGMAFPSPDAADQQSASAGKSLTFELKPGAGRQLPADGYRISIGDTARIEARTTAGICNATKTLVQLLRKDESITASASLSYLRGCEIEDWPTLPVRAIHFFSGRGGLNTQIKMLREVLGPMKVTHVVYHCDNIQWETHPEIYSPGSGMPKADAKAFAREAARRRIGVIPLMNTFGHSNWFLENEHYRRLADDPTNPFAYDPTMPEVYDLVHDLYGEAVELFRPGYFHIGHDEITLKGFPKKASLQKIGAMKLIADDIHHYRNWFAERGIRTMIWGDMFIGPGEANDFALAPSAEEARLRRSLIPKDIVICDWHYTAEPPAKYTSIRTLTGAGFDTIASTWYHSDNITGFAGAAAAARDKNAAGNEANGESLGLLQTTWAGYNLNDAAIEASSDQFAAYVLAAETAWNGGNRSSRNLGYDFQSEFARLWNRDLFTTASGNGWTVEKTHQWSAGFAGQRPAPIESSRRPASVQNVGEPHAPKPDGVPILRLGRFGFSANTESEISAIHLNGYFDERTDRQQHLGVDVDAKARCIVIACAATFAGAADVPIAEGTVKFDDATTSTFQFLPGRTVYPVDDFRSGPAAPLIGKYLVQNPTLERAIHGLIWKNPTPGKTISRIDIETCNQGPGLLIFGISGIE